MVSHSQTSDEAVAAVHRTEWGRIVSTLIRQTGDFELAEDAAQEAFAAALSQWRIGGVPDSPRAWIIGVARNKAIDAIRRRVRHREILLSLPQEVPPNESSDIPDDRLRLVCTCCHPALALEAQVALTLRTLGGLTTEEIARAFLVPESTMAQRLVRAKRKIREARIPYVVPDATDLPERLDAILRVLYLVFNEGYASTAGATMMKADLCAEAIRLARTLRTLLPTPYPEASALLSLMLLHDSRRVARLDSTGNLVTLEHQDRATWKHDEIGEALDLLESALGSDPGPYAVQATIAALHCRAERWEQTDWPQIVRLYDLLRLLEPSPVVELNRAVAVGMVEGPIAALSLINALESGGHLQEYHLLHAARADFLAKAGDTEGAARALTRALELVGNDAERRFLQARLSDLTA